MTKVKINLTSYFDKKGVFEFYSAETTAGKNMIYSDIGFKDINCLAQDILTEVKRFEIKKPEFMIISKPRNHSKNFYKYFLRKEKSINEDVKNSLAELLNS